MKKKILFVVPSRGFGGAEIHTLGVAEFFRDLGCRCDFCFPVIQETTQLVERCRAGGFSLIGAPIDLKPTSNRVEAFEFQRQVLLESTEVTGYDFAFIACPSPFSGIGAFKALSDAGVPTGLIFHLAHADIRFSPSELDYFKSVDRACSTLICVSDFTRDCVSQAIGLATSQFLVIENGIQLPDFDANSCPAFSALLGRQGAKIVLTSGRLHPQKGISVLLSSIEQVCAQRNDVHFVLAGEGPSRSEIEKFLNDRDMKDRVSLLGFVDEPYRIFDVADVVALPTLYEGLSLTLLEALHAGACILTTDASYQDRLLSHGEDSWVVPAGDVDAFAQGLEILLGDEALRDRLRTNARKKAKRFTYQRMLDEYFGVVQRSEQLEPGTTNTDQSPATRVYLNLAAVGSPSVTVRGGSGDLRFEFRELLTRGLTEVMPTSDGDLVEISYVGGETSRGRYTGARTEPVLSWILGAVEQYEVFEGTPVASFWSALLPLLIDHSSRSDLLDVWRRYLFHVQRFGGQQNGTFVWLLDRIDAVTGEACILVGQYARSAGAVESVAGLTASGPLDEGKGQIRSVVTDKVPRASRVLFFIPVFGLPEHNGSSARCRQVIQAYRDMGYQIAVLTFGVNPTTDARTRTVLKSTLGADLFVISASEETKTLHRKNYSLIGDGRIGEANFYSAEVAQYVYEFSSAFEPDIVHVNYVYFSWITAFCPPGARRILDTHDLISRRARVMADLKFLAGGAAKTVADIKDRLFSAHSVQSFLKMNFEIDHAEAQEFGAFDAVLFIADEEREWAQAAVTDMSAVWLPYLPDPDFSCADRGARREIRTAFVGGANLINIVGLALASRVSERLGFLIPDLSLWIIGRAGDTCPARSGIRKWGYVRDTQALLRQVDFSMSGQPCGTGQSIKVADSVAAGVPNVVFSAIAEGSMVEHGENGLVARDFDEYYEFCRQLAMDSGTLSSLKRSTRDWSMAHMGQAIFNDRFEKIIKGLP